MEERAFATAAECVAEQARALFVVDGVDGEIEALLLARVAPRFCADTGVWTATSTADADAARARFAWTLIELRARTGMIASDVEERTRAVGAALGVRTWLHPTTLVEYFVLASDDLCAALTTRIEAPLRERAARSAPDAVRTGAVVWCDACLIALPLDALLAGTRRAAANERRWFDNAADTVAATPRCPHCGAPARLLAAPPPPCERIERGYARLAHLIETLRRATRAVVQSAERAARGAVSHWPPAPTLVRARMVRGGPKYDVYIGESRNARHRRSEDWTLVPAPVRAARPTAAELDAYRAYVRSQPDLMRALRALGGRVLGCSCDLSACHGAVLIDLYRREAARTAAPLLPQSMK